MSRAIKLPWWANNNWWDAPEYARAVRDNEAQFRAALGAMQHHFGPGWWTDVFQSQKSNFVAAHLIGKGTMVLDFIRSLGISGYSPRMGTLSGYF